MNRASSHGLAWQAQGPGGPVIAPTLLCARLPSEADRALLEQACHQARIATRRWYQPLLQRSPVLRECCMLLEAPNAQDLERTLLGLPFFLGMVPQQRVRVRAILAQALGGRGR